MIKYKILPIPYEKLISPIKLWLFITHNIFSLFIKSIAGRVLYALTIGIVASAILLNSGFFACLAAYFCGLTVLLPLTLAFEEFFHAASCIARGKVNTIRNLIIGYYDINEHNLLPVFAAIDYRGQFNLIDKFYISAGGPAATAGLVLSAVLFTFFIEANIHIRLVLILDAFVPLVALVPSSFLVQSDGFNIKDVAQKLRMPWHYSVLSQIASIRYPLMYCFSLKRAFKNEFVNIKDTFDAIDNLIDNDRINEAITIYHKLLNIEPFNALYHNNLAWLYYQQGDLSKALRHSKKSIKLSPQDEDFNDTFKKIMLALGREVSVI